MKKATPKKATKPAAKGKKAAAPAAKAKPVKLSPLMRLMSKTSPEFARMKADL